MLKCRENLTLGAGDSATTRWLRLGPGLYSIHSLGQQSRTCRKGFLPFPSLTYLVLPVENPVLGTSFQWTHSFTFMVFTRFSASVLLFHIWITRLPKCPTKSFDVMLCIMEVSACTSNRACRVPGQGQPGPVWYLGNWDREVFCASLYILHVVLTSRVGSPGFTLDANLLIYDLAPF